MQSEKGLYKTFVLLWKVFPQRYNFNITYNISFTHQNLSICATYPIMQRKICKMRVCIIKRSEQFEGSCTLIKLSKYHYKFFYPLSFNLSSKVTQSLVCEKFIKFTVRQLDS